ncbi:MAG: YraN family protein [Deltaproteobacteria bacterium]|nr:YraN family protein [Deltaproteobacteria bacterium]
MSPKPSSSAGKPAPGSGPRKNLGARGEDAAAIWLARKGWQIVERNWNCALGELDIIARDGETYVFVEVRTKSGREFGSGIESVTPGKVKKLIRLAEAYVQSGGIRDVPLRIDVIGVDEAPDGTYAFEHVPNVTGY